MHSDSQKHPKAEHNRLFIACGKFARLRYDVPERFKRLEHADKKLFGIIAAVDMSEMLKKGVGGGGLCTRIQDETFSLESPGGFQTKCF